MTPTPAETALWRALNREPELDGTRGPPNGWTCWRNDQAAFATMHPADRLAYFEGKVRERGYQLSVSEHRSFAAYWRDGNDVIAAFEYCDTEHEARFHASSRALAALGVITDDVMKEIEDGRSE